MRVALIDDDRRYREGVALLLSRSPGFEVVDSFGDAFFAVAAAAKAGDACPWDVVLMDLEMPRMGGVEATGRLKAKWPELPIVVCTVFEEPATILQAICTGADGYLLKSTSAPAILSNLRSVAEGGSPMTPRVARSLVEIVRRQTEDSRDQGPKRLGLTEREQEVLRALVDGKSYRAVAEGLDISVDTVRTYIRRLYKKLQVHSAAEAVSRAIREGLV